MADRKNTTIQEIPKGFCQCGCGRLATICTETRPNRGLVRGEPNKFIRGHFNWKGGRYKDKDGYDLIYKPGHPRSHKNMVREHIFIAEQVLGKSLPPDAKVHHHTLEQLVICQDQAYHMLLHQRKRAYEACGHANWRKCWICKGYDTPQKLTISGNDIYHKSCATERMRKRRENETAKTKSV